MSKNLDGTRRTRVMLAVPNSGSIHPQVVARVVQLSQDPRYEVMYYPAKAARPMDRSRATIARNFLTTEAEFLVMIDSDNPPMNNVLDLIAGMTTDKAIIGCPTPAYDYRADEVPPIFWNAWNVTPEGFAKHLSAEERDGLRPIHFVGLGCVVIRRDVIEKLGIGAFAGSFDEHCVSNDDDDDQFCKRCHAAGFPVWVHWDYCCRHFKGGVDLYDVMQCYEAAMDERWASGQSFGDHVRAAHAQGPNVDVMPARLSETTLLPPPQAPTADKTCNVLGCVDPTSHTTREHRKAVSA